MRANVVLPMNVEFDKEYGRWDFAPRVLGQRSKDGRAGYLLSYNPKIRKYRISWDGIGTSDVTANDFVIIQGVLG